MEKPHKWVAPGKRFRQLWWLASYTVLVILGYPSHPIPIQAVLMITSVATGEAIELIPNHMTDNSSNSNSASANKKALISTTELASCGTLVLEWWGNQDTPVRLESAASTSRPDSALDEAGGPAELELVKM
ncbi:hypothetical protein BD289DRAFT_476315 [Coniella lustricola]|uniref:Uncharacterized protein n=1 Tax=Coniella lustricola TaxID=2025994 RepID=A0A2T2ZZ99_9PEZI|nr:hypothetical protein BD289DRAFT_476315 [Coniella lustricola]